MYWNYDDRIDESNFDYSAAECALEDAGCHYSEEIWGTRDKDGASDLLAEYGYSADDFMKK